MDLKKNKRRENILNAAANAFYKYGYSATSVDDIISQVGGSKRTIYNEFSNKEGIFKALIESNTNEVISSVQKKQFDDKNLEENLYNFGLTLTQAYMQPKMVGAYKVIVNESVRFPELAKIFFESGPSKAVTILENIIDRAKEKDEIREIETKKMADYFIGMLRSNLHLKVLLGLREIPLKEELEIFVKDAVSIFLKGIYK